MIDYCGKDNSKEIHRNWDGKKYRIGNAYLFTRKQGLFLSEDVDDFEYGRKETEYGSHVEESDEECGS